MQPSKSGQLNADERKKWVQNTAKYFAVFLIVFISVAIKAIPADWKYSVPALFIANTFTDLLTKYLQGT